jgi:hypothetical protein
MNYREFCAYMDETPGGRPPVVRIASKRMDPYLEGTYLEKGMLADVVIAKQVAHEGRSMVQVLFDFSAHWDHNQEFESSLWLLPPPVQDELGRVMGTMREAGILPNGQEEYLFPEDREIDFEILDERSLCLYGLWQKQVNQNPREAMGYIQWLEDLAAKRICG